jgi:hypothetical protein
LPAQQSPWIIRKLSRRTAAPNPIDSYVGTNPIAPVPRAMPVRVIRKVNLRPTRSPTQPNRKAPKGRIRNPAVKIPTVVISAALGWPFSKNLTDKIDTAKRPKI